MDQCSVGNQQNFFVGLEDTQLQRGDVWLSNSNMIPDIQNRKCPHMICKYYLYFDLCCFYSWLFFCFAFVCVFVFWFFGFLFWIVFFVVVYFVSRQMMEAIPCVELEEIKELYQKYDVIGVDEGQFFPDVTLLFLNLDLRD